MRAALPSSHDRDGPQSAPNHGHAGPRRERMAATQRRLVVNLRITTKVRDARAGPGCKSAGRARRLASDRQDGGVGSRMPGTHARTRTAAGRKDGCGPRREAVRLILSTPSITKRHPPSVCVCVCVCAVWSAAFSEGEKGYLGAPGGGLPRLTFRAATVSRGGRTTHA